MRDIPPLLTHPSPGPGGADPGFGPTHLLRLWFGLQAPVSRRAYALTGLGLMGIKYAVDAYVISAVTGNFFSPLDYLNPVWEMRSRVLNPAPAWLAWALVAWALPFLWVGVSMSIRRALNAGLSPWLGLVFFVPIFNYVLMVGLCLAPTKTEAIETQSPPGAAVDEGLRRALAGIALGMAVALAMVIFSVYVLDAYGAALFFGTPFMIGAISAYCYNHGQPRGYASTLAVSTLSVALSGSALLLFALEGLICVAMALPIAAPLGLFGGVIGRALALTRPARASHAAGALLVLPFLAGAEAVVAPTPLFEVVSAIEIDAPPARVWPHVIGFSDLPAPEQWFFRSGIAYPQRARIEGKGVGAVRYCEFSTGPFVEPITAWEPPRRLAFDVRTQPATMREWSPYRHVYPPHLNGTLRSRRGEFRLHLLPGNRTRLEGSTWYEMGMYPQAYWTLWSDALIHSIHGRVLRHIKQLSERQP